MLSLYCIIQFSLIFSKSNKELLYTLSENVCNNGKGEESVKLELYPFVDYVNEVYCKKLASCLCPTLITLVGSIIWMFNLTLSLKRKQAHTLLFAMYALKYVSFKPKV